ncbi:hypothetical protein KKF38_05245 [Patescibacteria group bacterium]|nr:hypothetical protein [Patescibacteria group bacterium]
MLKKIKSAKNVHVVGVSGAEGAAVALFLKKLKVNFTAHDFSEKSKFERHFKTNHFGYPAAKREKMLKGLLRPTGQIHFKNSYLESIESADLVFVSQNWEAYLPNQKLKKIFAKNPAKFATITQLYFQLFPGKIIAISGTNGKSTTAKLIAEIMKLSRQKKMSSGQQVADKNICQACSSESVATDEGRVDKSSRQTWFTGNDRRNIQILDCLDKWTKNDWLTIEVSNRQLKFPFGRAPDIGVILNVSPNHLNEYGGSFSAYRKGKFRLIGQQTKNEISVLNYDNPITRQFLKTTKGAPLPYSIRQKLSTGVYVENNWIVDKSESVQWTHGGQKTLSSRQLAGSLVTKSAGVLAKADPSAVAWEAKAEHVPGKKLCRVDNQICPVNKICLLGEHNLSNILAAAAATLAAGVDRKIICEAVSNFRGIPQRLELVSEKRGVKFINDSASTTPESTIAALRSFPEKSVNLIAGGDPKGVDYSVLSHEIKRRKVKVTLLESPLASILEKLLKKENVRFEVVKTLQEAVRISAKNAAKGECVLLSPAAAWFCYFAGKIPLGGRGFEKFVETLV